VIGADVAVGAGVTVGAGVGSTVAVGAGVTVGLADGAGVGVGSDGLGVAAGVVCNNATAAKAGIVSVAVWPL
jgi:hypothetical protein